MKERCSRVLRSSTFVVACSLMSLLMLASCGQEMGAKKSLPPMGSGGVRVGHTFWVDYAYVTSDLCFAIIYDAKHLEKGSRGTGCRNKDGAIEATAFCVATDGFTINARYESNKSLVTINGKDYSDAAGRLFYCRVDNGRLVISQFALEPQKMIADWGTSTVVIDRILLLLKSIPDTAALLKKE
jgi:hypothetical protein